jgi:hypothetical protein
MDCLGSLTYLIATSGVNLPCVRPFKKGKEKKKEKEKEVCL